MAEQQELDRDVQFGLQFVKVTVENGDWLGPHGAAGYLSDLSCKMLLVELNRRGYKIVVA